MLIKSADDKSKRLRLLEELAQSTQLDTWQKSRIREELSALRKGIAGERDAAHYIDTHYRHGENHAVIHDLRIVVDGEVAQIDHLMISRGLHFYLLETKNYNGSLTITEAGEFSVTYQGENTYGIPSPLEQSKRHEVLLRRLLARLEIGGRLGSEPVLHHVVLMDPKATIRRPAPKAFDSSMVIKADQFRTWHEKFVDQKIGMGELFKTMLNLRGSDALKELAEKIVRQHRPADLLALPDHLQPRQKPVPIPDRPPTQTPFPSAARNEGLPADPSVPRPPSPAVAVPSPAPQQIGDTNAVRPRTLVCAACRQKITFPEGKFCWNQPARFGGLQYCRQHQANFS